MKRTFIIVGLLVGCCCSLDAKKEKLPPLFESDTVVWAGLDYTLARMIGPGDFNNPEAIFPGYLDAWNDLFLAERVTRVAKAMKKRFVTDVGAVTERNRTASAKQITQSPGPEDTLEKTHITEKDIAEAVRSYQLKNETGLGLVFMVDRLIKPVASGAVYLVFFDVATREVIVSERHAYKTAGFGFRNYWFGFIKKADATLKKYR